jgi:hypothetical protein
MTDQFRAAIERLERDTQTSRVQALVNVSDVHEVIAALRATATEASAGASDEELRPWAVCRLVITMPDRVHLSHWHNATGSSSKGALIPFGYMLSSQQAHEYWCGWPTHLEYAQ